MDCRQIKDPRYALGYTTNLLMRVEPFASYHFGRFTKVLLGQIRRRHYLLTVAEGTAVGYVGWALCTDEVARAWVHQNRVPSFEECRGGDCWVGITFYAATREVCLFQVRHLRQRYPGCKIAGIRDYGARQRPTQLSNWAPANDAAA